MSWVDQVWPIAKHRTEYRAPKSVDVIDCVTCQSCHCQISQVDFDACFRVCPSCGHHHLMTAKQRLDFLTGSAPYEEIGEDLHTQDVLSFCDTKPYAKRLVDARKKTQLSESVLSVVSSIDKIDVVLSIFEFGFIGGSLGEVAGGRVVRAIQTAIKRKLPFICVTASGGARMQEGMLSLLQMAKMSAAVNQLRQTRLPFFNVLTHPTFGGVSASIAMQGDIIIAEKGAHIGFTGARVIANSMGGKLPEGFQTAEFLCQHGGVDCVLERKDLVAFLSRMLKKATVNGVDE